jgi:hypothetical protein
MALVVVMIMAALRFLGCARALQGPGRLPSENRMARLTLAEPHSIPGGDKDSRLPGAVTFVVMTVFLDMARFGLIMSASPALIQDAGTMSAAGMFAAVKPREADV